MGEGLQAYDLIKKACKIESRKPQTHTRKDLQKAMIYLLKAQTCAQIQNNLREALKCYRAALIYVSGIRDGDGMASIDALLRNIQKETALCL